MVLIRGSYTFIARERRQDTRVKMYNTLYTNERTRTVDENYENRLLHHDRRGSVSSSQFSNFGSSVAQHDFLRNSDSDLGNPKGFFSGSATLLQPVSLWNRNYRTVESRSVRGATQNQLAVFSAIRVGYLVPT